MGMKPRITPTVKKTPTKKKKTLRLNASTKEGIEVYAETLRKLLKKAGVKKEDYEKIWNNLEDFPNADADWDIQWFVGWFTGVAECLGCNFEDLVEL